MVTVSPEANDRPFLNEQIETLGLSAMPTPSFWKEAGWAYFSPRYRRYVEKYPWGIFLVAAERQKPFRGFSAVCVGEHDASTGVTKGTEEDALHDLRQLFPWYVDLLAEVATAKPEIPPCMGKYKPRAVACDGGTYGASGYVEPACGWRDACGRLQAWCEKKRVPPDQVLRNKNPESMMAFVELLEPFVMPPVDLASTIEKIITTARGLNPRQRPDELSLGRVHGKAARHLAYIAEEANVVRQKRLLHIVARLCESVVFRLGRRFASSALEAEPGDCFLATRESGHDKHIRHGWVAIYVRKAAKAPPSRPHRTERRGGVAIVKFTALPMLNSIDVEFPVSDLCPPIARSFGGRTKPPTWRESGFRTRVRIENDIDLPVVVEVALQLVRQGHIKLPPVQEAP
jgi:hypothetical protein